MTTFDERESGFEAKYIHDENLEFRIQARANKLAGLWAAELLGKQADAADAYATEVVKSDFQEPGNDDVVAKLAGDLGDLATEDHIRRKLADCLTEARAQLGPDEG